MRRAGRIQQRHLRLRQTAYLEGRNNEAMRITDAGAAALGMASSRADRDALIQYWLTHRSLGAAERKALQALVDASREA